MGSLRTQDVSPYFAGNAKLPIKDRRGTGQIQNNIMAQNYKNVNAQ
jgi:hypothetical protein